MSERQNNGAFGISTMLDSLCSSEQMIIEELYKTDERQKRAYSDRERLCNEIAEEYESKARKVNAECDAVIEGIVCELKEKKRLLSESREERKKKAELMLSRAIGELEDAYSEAIDEIERQYNEMLDDAQREYESLMAQLISQSLDDERAGAANAEAINNSITQRLRAIEKAKRATAVNVSTAITERGEELKRLFCKSASTVSTVPPLSASLLSALSEYYGECEKEEALKGSYTTAAECTSYTFADGRQDEIEADRRLALANAASIRGKRLSTEKRKFEQKRSELEADVNEKYLPPSDPAAEYARLKKKALDDIMSAEEDCNARLDSLSEKMAEETDEIIRYVSEKTDSLRSHAIELLSALANAKSRAADRIEEYLSSLPTPTDDTDGEVTS